MKITKETNMCLETFKPMVKIVIETTQEEIQDSIALGNQDVKTLLEVLDRISNTNNAENINDK